MKLRIALVASLIYSTQCLAMFCPNSFNLINVGDSPQRVEAMCGPPASKKFHLDEAVVPQEWTYFLQIPTYGMSPASFNGNPGTIKFTVAFTDNAVTNISSNGIGVGATTICKNVNIQIGTNLKDVEKACGKPALITKTNQPGPTGQIPLPNQILEWTYVGNKTVTLVFENDRLKEVK